MPYTDHHLPSVTMFRIGRDRQIINFDPASHTDTSIICLVYGEIDCRCHIHRQVNLGHAEDEVIRGLVSEYFATIKQSLEHCAHSKIIIVGVIPPTAREDYESLHGPIMHEFPFVGTDIDRVRYTAKMNATLQAMCDRDGYVFFNPFEAYARLDGTLKHELSDTIVHLEDNAEFLRQFGELVGSFSSI